MIRQIEIWNDGDFDTLTILFDGPQDIHAACIVYCIGISPTHPNIGRLSKVHYSIFELFD